MKNLKEIVFVSACKTSLRLIFFCLRLQILMNNFERHFSPRDFLSKNKLEDKNLNQEK